MRQYLVRETIPEDVRDALAAYPELLQKLLYGRGIETAAEAETFLNPDYDLHTHDPFLMKDMERAVQRVLRAMEESEKIVIYSDYDCDGIPGGVLLHDLFVKLGYDNFENYIPHRHEEGYGLNLSAVEKCALGGSTLMITVDCGITDVVPIARANELGLDVIITDHHLVPDEPPPAYAILNPKQKGDSYPFDMLCGTGVAFKFAQAILQRVRAKSALTERSGDGGSEIHPEWEKWLLDMAGLATIADMVPLIDENRVFAHYGLTVLRKSPRPGLHALCRAMRVAKHLLTEDDVGFMVAPRINAASRMGLPEDAFRLLATRDAVLAERLAKHLHVINDRRKGLVAATAKEAKRRLSGREKVASVVVLGDPRWRPALLGLVANTLSKEYARPVFLWGREGGETIKGSCRSAGDVSVVALMERVADLFIDYGGHAFSGGFSTEVEKVHLLEDALSDAHALLPKDARLDRRTDLELSLDDVSWETYGQVEKLAPFGEGNSKPLFLFRDIEITAVECFGKEKNHLRLTFKRTGVGPILAIGFFSSPDAFTKPVSPGEHIDLVATMEKSFFRSRPELRLRIVDIL